MEFAIVANGVADYNNGIDKINDYLGAIVISSFARCKIKMQYY